MIVTDKERKANKRKRREKSKKKNTNINKNTQKKFLSICKYVEMK